MNTPPVLLLSYNKEDTTRKVFEVIRQAKPAFLYIFSDGPKNEEDRKNIKLIRSFLKGSIDWDCQVKYLFNEFNQGCKLGVKSAIDWFFTYHEAGIILEDDTLPDISFFEYCYQLLEKYKAHEKIMMISGTNYIGKINMKESYAFLGAASIWGWATWKRAWEKNDVFLESYDDEKRKLGGKFYDTYRNYKLLEKVKKGEINSWAIGWVYSIRKNQGLAIWPKYNLIENIGIEHEKGTNTIIGKPMYEATIRKLKMEFPLIHPDKLISSPWIYQLYKSNAENYSKRIRKKTLFDFTKKVIKKLFS